MKKLYYQFAVISHPTAQELEKDENASSEVVSKGEFLASTQKNAELHIVKGLTDTQFERLEMNGLEILLRPF